ncbi:MAG: lipopolysaccharide heptosyltransferase II [Gammaproteobacteria bacterium]
MTERPFKILVIGPSWVGDMVMAQSLFIALTQEHHDCSIDVVAPPWSLQLLQRMPEINRAIAMPVGRGQFNLSKRIGLGQSLRDSHYHQAIVLPNSWKSALVPFFAGIPLRTGYLGELRWGLLNDVRKLDKKRLPMTVQRFVALAFDEKDVNSPDYPLPKLHIAATQRQAVVDKFALAGQDKILALCPGAEYGPAKRWPVYHFAEVAKTAHRNGWRVWLFGSEKDRAVANEINALSENICLNLAGNTSLAEAVDAMSLVNAVVSNDSGLMHVAAALEKKVIAVYGSSDPNFTPPLHPSAQIISLKLDCSPCFKRDCPLGHTRCLNDITPGRVLAALGI